MQLLQLWVQVIVYTTKTGYSPVFVVVGGSCFATVRSSACWCGLWPFGGELLSDNNPAANYRRSLVCGDLVFTGHSLCSNVGPRVREDDGITSVECRSRVCGNLVFTGSFALLKHGSPRSRGRRYNPGGMSFSRMRESSVYGFIRSAQTWITACARTTV